MPELVRTNNPAVIATVEALLGESEIPYQVADRNMSVLEGSIGAIQARVLVSELYEVQARALLVEAGLGHWLRS